MSMFAAVLSVALVGQSGAPLYKPGTVVTITAKSGSVPLIDTDAEYKQTVAVLRNGTPKEINRSHPGQFVLTDSPDKAWVLAGPDPAPGLDPWSRAVRVRLVGLRGEWLVPFYYTTPLDTRPAPAAGGFRPFSRGTDPKAATREGDLARIGLGSDYAWGAKDRDALAPVWFGGHTATAKEAAAGRLVKVPTGAIATVLERRFNPLMVHIRVKVTTDSGEAELWFLEKDIAKVVVVVGEDKSPPAPGPLVSKEYNRGEDTTYAVALLGRLETSDSEACTAFLFFVYPGRAGASKVTVCLNRVGKGVKYQKDHKLLLHSERAASRGEADNDQVDVPGGVSETLIGTMSAKNFLAVARDKTILGAADTTRFKLTPAQADAVRSFARCLDDPNFDPGAGRSPLEKAFDRDRLNRETAILGEAGDRIEARRRAAEKK
jgi:hypothetical protein